MGYFSLRECFMKAWSVFYRNMGSVLVVHGMPYVVFLFAGALMVEGRGLNLEWLSAIFILVAVLGALFVQVLLIFYFNEACVGESVDWGVIFRDAWCSWGKFWLCSIVYILMTCMGLMFFVIPGIWVAVSFVFISHGVLLKQKGFWEAMVYSRSLVMKARTKMVLLLGLLFFVMFSLATLGQLFPWVTIMVVFLWVPYMLASVLVAFRMLESLNPL